MCNNNGNCIAEILEKILLIQQVDNCNSNGCNRPFLGDNISLLANTRPVNLYCCCTNSIWTMPYENGDDTGTSSAFRIENINDNTATFRILIPQDTGFSASNSYFTINLDYVSCISCLPDTLITNL